MDQCSPKITGVELVKLGLFWNPNLVQFYHGLLLKLLVLQGWKILIFHQLVNLFFQIHFAPLSIKCCRLHVSFNITCIRLDIFKMEETSSQYSNPHKALYSVAPPRRTKLYCLRRRALYRTL